MTAKIRGLVVLSLAAAFLAGSWASGWAAEAETNLVVEKPSGGRGGRVAPRLVDGEPVFEIGLGGGAERMQDPTRTTNLVATGAWSEPVSDGHGNLLRARLQVYEGTHSTNASGRAEWSASPVYVEIQDVAGTNQHPTKIYIDELAGLGFDLRDVNGTRPENVRRSGGSYGMPPPDWITLPAGGRMRLNASNGVRSGGNDGDLHLRFRDLNWKSPTRAGSVTITADNTNVYFLSATLLPPPTNAARFYANVWQGVLAVPAVKISAVRH